MKDFKWNLLIETLIAPPFILALIAMTAIIVALFKLGENNKELTLALITVLTNVITAATTFYYTKHQISSDK